MHAARWAKGWMVFGLLWFLLAIALAPSNKIYQQGLVLFVWLPALVFAWSSRPRLVELWRAQRLICTALLALAVWALITLVWAEAPKPAHEAKRLLYILVFLLFFPILADGQPERVIRIMQWGGVGLSLTALMAIIHFYGIEHKPLVARLEGLGELSHPILGGYVIGLAAVWMLHWMPRSTGLQVLWAVALALLGIFVVMSQSRGAALALLLSVLAMPIYCRDPRSRVIAATALALAMLTFWLLEPLVMARGSSYRPEIFMSSLHMIAERPWGGLGLASDYKVMALGRPFDHAHNLFSHVAILLGLPGLALWCIVWFAVLREAWRARDSLLGRGVLGMWIFSFLAMQFDAASLTGTPRAEWFISWLPIGLASVLTWAQVKSEGCDKIPRSS
ncbi:O-antigen ligase family protein [Pseudomonas corrugata]|uniref:O-antigen ligase family protein n=1 Tax=Pseudomonas corrugata TaxID=47879 RepID=UPI000466F6F3|nr:O-antigen ligase family protein [Pseudomonas corrugata]MDU9021602.1 O-antigen ligase family protein [Pseudomonas corrugata]MDU9039347.1 O-antigen ligase family protein [Pseudomonas corrugata]UZE06793.1 O-antigen ligase family protein [Pseudomonas corrugata]